MKVLGKNSISSVVEKFLIVLLIFGICALITGTVIFMTHTDNITKDPITAIILGIIYLSGFPAIIIILAFINIFNALKNGETFSNRNVKSLKVAYKVSLVIGIMYLINAVLIIITPKIQEVELTWNHCINMYNALALAMVFIIFGVGLIVLNKIYEKAIEYKNENELTI